MTGNVIIVDSWPRRPEQIFDSPQWERLGRVGDAVACDSRTEGKRFDGLLPEAVAILGQPDLPTDRLERARNLRALINVEGNFFQNVDYAFCFRAGISVLSIAPAFAVPVAEMTIGLALDLARGITLADAAVRNGTEVYGSRGGTGAMLLSRANVGIVGYGSIGRAVRQLLRGFSARVRVFDPWLPAGLLRDDDCEPAALEAVLASCDYVFVCAAATSENRHLLGARELGLMRPGAALVLVSRADVVDFDALLSVVDAGRIRAAVDVFPHEPIPPDDPVRSSKLLLSPHRAGGMRAAMSTAAEMIIEDLGLIVAGLPPVRLLAARRETVLKASSKPASYK